MTLDEEADMMLKSKAHQMTEAASQGSAHSSVAQTKNDSPKTDTDAKP